MRKFFLFFIVFISSYQINGQFSDSFDDSDFINNPSWMGNINKFEVDSLKQLHNKYDSLNGESYLSTECKVSEDAIWEFNVSLLFNPSSSNYSKVYLMSDEQELSECNNGYFVKVGGESASVDDVSLYSVISGFETKIIDGIDGVAALNPNLKIKVTRDLLGNFELLVDTSSSFISMGVAAENSINTSEYFGVFCKYTKTRSDKFYFDDFSVSGSWDTISPQNVNENDIVINEIFIDPTPSIGLPEYEYIELYNRTNTDVILTNWTLKIGTTEKVFPLSEIKADSFVVLLKSDIIDSFPQNISKIGFTSVSLTNAAGEIYLYDNYGKLISSVEYTDSWYNDDNKKEGGWSIEQIEPNLFCEEKNNWRASIDAIGGTPGKKNSVSELLVHSENLRIINAYAQNSNSIKVHFNKKMDSSDVSFTGSYSVDKEIGIPINVTFLTETSNEMILSFSDNFQSSVIYYLSVKTNLSDCSGNEIDTTLRYKIALADSCLTYDIIINEILFDPKDDGVDYVEIFNNSDKVFDLKYFRISNYLLDWNTPENWKVIIEDSRFIFPDEYWVLTTDSAKVKHQYSTENPYNFIQLESMPTFSNDEGTVAIIHKSLLNTIDVLAYSDEMHHPLLSDFDGVSLERISPEMGEWQSASSTSGFGTPTFRNSQFISNILDGEITFSSEIFSPNNDGFEDALIISWEFERTDLMGSISVYNSDGMLLNVLVNNEFLGASGSKLWNGTDENNFILTQGMYIILIDVISDDGFVNKYKKVVVLSN